MSLSVWHLSCIWVREKTNKQQQQKKKRLMTCIRTIYDAGHQLQQHFLILWFARASQCTRDFWYFSHLKQVFYPPPSLLKTHRQTLLLYDALWVFILCFSRTIEDVNRWLLLYSDEWKPEWQNKEGMNGSKCSKDIQKHEMPELTQVGA